MEVPMQKFRATLVPSRKKQQRREKRHSNLKLADRHVKTHISQFSPMLVKSGLRLSKNAVIPSTAASSATAAAM